MIERSIGKPQISNSKFQISKECQSLPLTPSLSPVGRGEGWGEISDMFG
jgi:hypothetical protein